MIFGFSKKYWTLNFIIMIERLSYWVALLQIPIYIAQKDAVGGLQFDQVSKGIIFFWWALVQNLSPVLLGGVADKLGYRKSLIISSVIVIIGYILLATQREFYPFLFGTMVLGFGLGTFKPALQGWFSIEIPENKSSIGWGIYVFAVNFAVFFGPPIALYLKAISWQFVFFGSAAIFAINLIVLFIIKPSINKSNELIQIRTILPKLFKTIIQPKIAFFVLLMSGFTMTYMQFYETLPNFIFDWSDTSSIAYYLPEFMTSDTMRGKMIAYEWLYNLNSGLIILFVLISSKLTSKYKITKVLIIGILLSGVGLFVAGFSQSGLILIMGILIYSTGEIITNPKFTEYIAKIAHKESKSMYMGIMNISWAIGLAGGGLMGGFIYQYFGEKSGFANQLLMQQGIMNTPNSEAFAKAMELTNLSHAELTQYLWNTYNPNFVWLPFLLLSLLSVIGMYYYSKKYNS